MLKEHLKQLSTNLEVNLLKISIYLADESLGCIRASTYEAFYLLGLFDLDSLSDEIFAETLQCFFVLALFKSLYFSKILFLIYYLKGMFDMFRALVGFAKETCLYQMFKQVEDLAKLNDRLLNETVTNPNNQFI